MTHWWASKSNGYCAGGTSGGPCPFGAERSCPGSSKSAAGQDTVAATDARPVMSLDDVCEASRNPRAFSDEHRKMPANVVRPVFGYRWLAVVADDRCETNSDPLAGESPAGQTRRNRLLGHWGPIGSHGGESVFLDLSHRSLPSFHVLVRRNLTFFSRRIVRNISTLIDLTILS